MFLGASQARHEVPGFSIALLSASLRAEEVALHTHPNASFVLVLGGNYRSNADGAGRLSPPSTLFFNPAGTTHRDSFVEANGRFLAVSLSEPSRRIAAQDTKLPAAAQAFSGGDPVNTAFRLARQCLQPAPDAAANLEGLCWELLSNVAGEKLWTEEAVPSWLRRAQEFLQDRCGHPLSIAGMAEQLDVHPVHLARAFRKAFRCTPGEYLMRCRLRKAITLLRGSRFTLAEIALAAGFFDQSHLTRSFRRHFGLAPYAYRKACR
jgi:AraC family transcriptional regulator